MQAEIVCCDDCGREQTVRVAAPQPHAYRAAREQLRSAGWEADAYSTYCPDCVAASWVGEGDD